MIVRPPGPASVRVVPKRCKWIYPCSRKAAPKIRRRLRDGGSAKVAEDEPALADTKKAPNRFLFGACKSPARATVAGECRPNAPWLTFFQSRLYGRPRNLTGSCELPLKATRSWAIPPIGNCPASTPVAEGPPDSPCPEGCVIQLRRLGCARSPSALIIHESPLPVKWIDYGDRLAVSSTSAADSRLTPRRRRGRSRRLRRPRVVRARRGRSTPGSSRRA